MSAPDFPTVYEFETRIETAIVNALFAENVIAKASRDNNVIDATELPFVAVQLAVGGTTGHYAPNVQSYDRPDRWNGVVSLTVRTNRTVEQSTPQHQSTLSIIRSVMYAIPHTLTSAELPYHEIHTVDETGTVVQVIENADHDVSVISFAITFGIRPDAWPEAGD